MVFVYAGKAIQQALQWTQNWIKERALTIEDPG